MVVTTVDLYVAKSVVKRWTETAILLNKQQVRSVKQSTCMKHMGEGHEVEKYSF